MHYLKHFATSLVAALLLFALPAQAIDEVDGVYQVSTADDFVAFASLVNSGTTSAKCVLTGDIDMKGVTWTPIGTSENPFRGTIDGGFHKIKNLVVKSYDDYQGLIGYVSGGAVIENLVIDGSCSFSGGSYVAAFAGGSQFDGDVYFRRCGNEADVTGTGVNVSAFAGVSMSGAVAYHVTDCYNTGSISGGSESAIITGWGGSKSEVENFYNVGPLSGGDEGAKICRGPGSMKNVYDLEGIQGTAFSAEDLSSGKLAVMLNGATRLSDSAAVWRQNLDNGKTADTKPVFDTTHAVAYPVGTLQCDGQPVGELTYSNTYSTVINPHQFENGVCKVCGTMDDSYMSPAADGIFEIGNEHQLRWFAMLVNNDGKAHGYSARLTSDIDFSEYSNQGIYIGEHANDFTGTFDGQGHTILIAYDVKFGYIGLFRNLNGGTVRNLTVDGSLATTGGHAGGVASFLSGGGTIENCVSHVNISCSLVGDGTNGGIVANADYNTQIRNCAFTGSITGSAWNNGGIAGWSGDGSVKIDRCYVSATLADAAVAGDGASYVISRNTPTITDCYYISSGTFTVESAAKQVSAEALASGELAFRLNGKSGDAPTWFQNIDNGLNVDDSPVPDSSHGTVYVAGEMRCDGQPLSDQTYSNTNSAVIPPHTFVDGICQVCNMLDSTYLTPAADGVYEISDAKQLRWFAELVNRDGEKHKYGARLTDDIDFTEYTQQNVMIGPNGNNYTGTFDGQGHTVYIDYDTDIAYVGLFFSLKGTVRNLVTEGTITTSAGHAGGIASYMVAGSTIESCRSNVKINCTLVGDGTNGGIAANAEDNTTVRTTAFTGSITGSASNNGGIVGWASFGSTSLEACYVSATLEDAATAGDGASYVFARNSPKISNCCYLDNGTFTINDGAKQYEEEMTYTGELAYLLNGSSADSPLWFQNIDNDKDLDEYPVTDATHGTVYAVGTVDCGGKPVSSEGFSNFDNTKQLPHNFEEGVCSVCGTVLDDYLKPGDDGYVEIKTPGELNWFARYVNKGNFNTNAKLGADIDFSKYTAEGLMIGTSNTEGGAYLGKFDGQGHTITVAYDRSESITALFRAIGGFAEIRNLTTAGTIRSGWHAAGFTDAMYGHSQLINCLSTIAFTSAVTGGGDASIGGLATNTSGWDVRITNCGFAGSIESPEGNGNAGLVSWSDGCVADHCYVAATFNVPDDGQSTIFARNSFMDVNCYYVDPGSVTINQTGIDVTEDQVKNGELAYMLNNNMNGGKPWVQTIGSDDYPFPSGQHGTVYATGDVNCDGTILEIVCTNTESAPKRGEHSYDEMGICGTCGQRLISTPDQLLDASISINSGVSASNINILLASDIDMSGVEGYLGIGTTDIPFTGHFDGQGHVISNLVINATTNFQGLLGVAAGNAVIENVTLDNTCSIRAGSYAAGILGGTNGWGMLTIRNCGNEASVSVSRASGVNAAGIVGVDNGGSSVFRIENCYNTGNISGGSECAGISGYVGNGAIITNTYNAGTVSSGLDGANTFVRYSGAPLMTNCYESTGSQATSVSDDAVKSGELCFLLNGGAQGGEPFLQTLGQNDHPVLHLSKDKVYEANGTYTNDLTGIESAKAAKKATGGKTRIYTTDGVEIPALQKGINIVRQEDGTVKKVLVK